MSDVLPIKLQVTGDTKIVAAVRKEIEQLAAASAKVGTQASAASAKQAAAYSKIQQSAAQAATSNQKLATETQKTAAASNQAATAAQKLATEQQRTATQAANAAKAQNQAAASAIRLAQAQNSAASGGSYFSKVGDAVAGSLANMVGPAAVVTASLAALKTGFDMAQAGAALQGVEQSFTSLAASGGQSADTLLSKMNAAAQGTISDAQLMQSANTGMLLTNGKLASELPKLIEIARASARATGQEVSFVFDSLVRGIARGSPLIIDNAGITLNAAQAFDTYAASIGKSADELSKSEQQQATLNAVVAAGNDIISKTGGTVENNATKFAQAGTYLENAKNAFSTFLADGIAPTVESFNTFASSTSELIGWIQQIGTTTPGAEAAMAAFDAEMERSGSVTQAEIAYQKALVEAQQQVADAAAFEAQAVGASTDANAAAAISYAQSASLIPQVTAAQIGYANALEMSTVQAAAAAQAAQMKANADQLASADAQTHAVAMNALAAEAQLAAAALMKAGPQGAATAAMLAGSSSQIDIMTAAFYRLAAAQAAAGIAATKAKLDRQTPRQLIGADSEEAELRNAKHTQAVVDRAQSQKEARAVAAAQREQIIATGTAAQKTAILQKEYDDAVRLHGAQSAAAIDAQTKLIQATEKGGAARTSSAGAAATKLEGIETKTGDKLSQIVQDTQAKLIAIDQKAADERAKIAADLANKIATSAADRRAANEADDLDLIGVTDEKAAQKLNDREKAQAAAREREVAAAKEAQDAIANGEAESASKVYDVREKQISDQQALDEKYAERQRELAGNDEALAALQTQYDEATRANEEAANTRIAIAKAEAEQKKAEVQAEKDAVIAAANEQANSVVAAAERSAAGVTKATASAKTAAVANLKAIGDAVTAIPASKTITITVTQSGTVGAESAGTPKAAGGGTFMTSGKTNLVVGDNPGGRELVTVTPISGRGTTRMGGGLIAMAGGGQVVVDAGGGYTTPIAGGTPAAGGGGGSGGGKKAAAIDPKKALDEMKNTIQMLMDMAKLKEQIADLAGVPAFDIPVVQALVNRAQEFTAYVAAHLIPITKAEGESLGRYLSAAKDAASFLGDMASLKKDIAELKNVPAFDRAMVFALIDRAQEFTAAVQSHLIPLTEFERDQIGRYTQVVQDVVSMLKDVADLKKELAEPQPPIDTAYIWQLVADAAAVTIIMREKLIGTTEEQADAIGLYASAAGDTIAILNDVLDLGKTIKENGAGGAISDQLITRLADQAQRITAIMQARLLPVTKEQAEAASLYADLVGSSVSALKDVASLGKDLFTDYVSPTDAQIAMLANDAKRVAAGFFAAGQIMGKDGAEAGKAYAEGVGAAFSAAKEGLLVIDALKSGDFVLPDAALKQFQSSSLDILTVMEALGGRAATIPTSDIAALQTITAAVASQSEALIKLAAVPFGDLAGAGAGLSASGGVMGSTTTIYNTFNLPPGSTQQTVDAVIRQLNMQMGARR